MNNAEIAVEMYPMILKFARKCTLDEYEDLASDVVVRILRTNSRFRDEADLNSWLWTIVKNEWRSRLREKSCRPQFDSFSVLNVNAEIVRENDEADGEGIHSLQYTLDHDHLETEFVFAEFWKHAATLSQPHREVLLLNLQGCTYSEISARLRVGIGTARSRLHYARKYIRSAMAGIRGLYVAR